MRDSMVDMAKMNRIQNAGLTIERNRQARQMAEARSRLEQERTTRRIGFAALGLGLLVLIGAVSMMYYTGRMRRRSHSALQRMSSIREQFYTNVTHEFRTPLTVILGLSDELQKDAADEAEVRAKAQIIERQGRGLLTLINHLLDIAKIKSAVGNADWRNGNIVAYISMIIDSYRDYAHSRHITLRFTAREEVTLDFVPDYVRKVMNNLLSNAFKFPPPMAARSA